MKKIDRALFLAVTAGLMVGVHTPSVLASYDAETHTFTTTNQIIENVGDFDVQKNYWQTGVRNDGLSYNVRFQQDPDEGYKDIPTYKFKDNVVLNISVNSKNFTRTGSMGAIMAGIDWRQDENGRIQMNNNKLTINIDGNNGRYVDQQGHTWNFADTNGIGVYSGHADIVDVAGLDITINNVAKGNAIRVQGDASQGAYDSGKGDAALTIWNDDTKEHAVKIRTNSQKLDSGIFVNKNSGSAKLDIKGLVDMDFNGYGTIGLWVKEGEASIGGGKIVSKNYKAIQVHAGTALINAKYDSNGEIVSTSNNRDVEIYGNIVASGGGKVAVAFNTKDSKFTGGVTQDGSKVDFILSNGAIWNNICSYDNDNFGGTGIHSLVGGSDAVHAGYILQKDVHRLNVDNYSGHSVIVYEHTGDGSKATDYKAGDTVINSAAKGSGIVISTDNNGINMQDEKSVESTLNALAGKLLYMNSDKDQNLAGKVQIAGGLTASSAAMQVGDIAFDEAHRGGYVAGSMAPGFEKPEPPVDPDKPVNPEPPVDPDKPVNPEPPVDPDKPGDIEYGDKETYLMQGARVAMTDAMLSWRDIAADSFVRTSELRNGSEEGAWVRVFGGETKYEGNKTNVSGSYYAVQAGFDQEFGNGWNAGLMVDYKDGESDYLLNGEGDYKTYSVGVYGTKDFGDDSYLDLAAKVGQVKNEYTVYNEIGQKLEGEYKAPGYSISAQYGKRIASDNGYVEPQLQLTWAHVDSDNYNAHSGEAVLNINQDAFDSLVGRLGIEAGQTSDRGGLYARLSLNHEFSGDVDGVYYAKDGGRKGTSFDVGDTWTDLTLGGHYNLSKCSNFYADVTKTLAGDYKQDWKVNAGFSFAF